MLRWMFWPDDPYSILTTAIKISKSGTHVIIDIDKIPATDQKNYQLLSSAETTTYIPFGRNGCRITKPERAQTNRQVSKTLLHEYAR